MNDDLKKRKILWYTTLVIVLVLVLFLIYWGFWWRFKETTDDAYVNGNLIQVTPQQKGIVTAIFADNTQLVEAGQPLIELDRNEYEIALDRAKADLGDAVREVEQMFIKVREVTAKLESVMADLFQANQDFHHRKELVADGSVSGEDYEHSQSRLFSIFAKTQQVEQETGGGQSQVANTRIETHPKVEQAKASLKKAFLALHRCTVLSPVRGIATQRKAQVGQWVEASDPLLSIVPVDQIWVDANYREVDLRNLRLSQPVTLYADMYGKGIKYHGKIVGLNPGTGSVFSILPPQNASGNWIKIIQRIPVKISLQPEEIQTYPLMLGVSVTVTTDTHDRSGARLPEASRAAPLYRTEIYANELDGVDEMVEQIIADNLCSYDPP